MTNTEPPTEQTTGDSPEQIAQDVAAVGKLAMVPKLLEILLSLTGMGFAAVARVTDSTWTACATRDHIRFGLQPGGQLEVNSTLCIEVRASREPIVIDHASLDPNFCNHHTPRTYRIESYISVPIVLPDGRYFGNLCAIDPAPARLTQSNALTVFQGFADLIATELQAEFQRQEMLTALQDERAARELREQFIAILGHDLRNPLHAIIATGQLLEIKYAGDEVLAGMGARIRKSGRRMSLLIDDVLDFARGRLGDGISINPVEVSNVDVMLANVVEELRDSWPDRRIESGGNAARPIRCDIGRIQQVVSNLIGNALAHGSRHSPVRVTVNYGAEFWELRVWNDGNPIPPEALGKIFDPFWRQATSSERKGLGLGLHISAQIVRAHGGTISVTSSAEAGTEFTVRVPTGVG